MSVWAVSELGFLGISRIQSRQLSLRIAKPPVIIDYSRLLGRCDFNKRVERVSQNGFRHSNLNEQIHKKAINRQI